MDRTKGTNYVMIIGRWNAVVGDETEGISIGKYVFRKRNSRGEKPAEFCDI